MFSLKKWFACLVRSVIYLQQQEQQQQQQHYYATALWLLMGEAKFKVLPVNSYSLAASTTATTAATTTTTATATTATTTATKLMKLLQTHCYGMEHYLTKKLKTNDFYFCNNSNNDNNNNNNNNINHWKIKFEYALQLSKVQFLSAKWGVVILRRIFFPHFVWR